MYTEFANVYDRLMREVDEEAWAARYARMLGKPPLRVTECACGTGAVAIPLAETGYQMTGTDLSGEMLAVAMEKAAAKGVRIPFVQQDMRRLRVTRPQDAVMAACDGVNYLTDEKSVLSFFSAAREALKPGGKLLFDISSAYKLENILGNNTFTLDEEDNAYIWLNRFDEKKRLVRMELTIFTREGKNFRRLRESQVQRAHTAEELEHWLKETGFSSVRFSGKKEDRAPAERDERIFVSAERL